MSINIKPPTPDSLQYIGRGYAPVSYPGVQASTSNASTVETVSADAVMGSLTSNGVVLPSAVRTALQSSTYVDVSTLNSLTLPGASTPISLPASTYPPGTMVSLADLANVPELSSYAGTYGLSSSDLTKAAVGTGGTRADSQAWAEAISSAATNQVQLTQGNSLLTPEQKAEVLDQIAVSSNDVLLYIGSADTTTIPSPLIPGAQALADGTTPNSAVTAPLQPEVPAPPGESFYQIGRRAPAGVHTRVDVVNLVNNKWVRVNLPWRDGYNIESLVLTASPDTFSVTSNKIMNKVYTLTRWVEEHWGDDLDQVTFSGSTFGFLIPDIGYIQSDSRRITNPYLELRSLVDLYKSNGLQYQTADLVSGVTNQRDFYSPVQNTVVRSIVTHPRAGMVKQRNYIRISFDFATFIGYFDSFEVTEATEGSPFAFKYSVAFKAELTTWT